MNPLRATCPRCGLHGDLDVFFIEAEAKAALVLIGDLPAPLGRVAVGYLGLFAPPKSTLRLPKARRLLGQLRDLVEAGTVCADARIGTRRQATPAMWAQGIEQMLNKPPSELPLSTHNYLRKIVYGIADRVDAEAERQRETDAQRSTAARRAQEGVSPVRPVNPMEEAIAQVHHDRHMGFIDEATATQRLAELRGRRA